MEVTETADLTESSVVTVVETLWPLPTANCQCCCLCRWRQRTEVADGGDGGEQADGSVGGAADRQRRQMTATEATELTEWSVVMAVEMLWPLPMLLSLWMVADGGR